MCRSRGSLSLDSSGGSTEAAYKTLDDSTQCQSSTFRKSESNSPRKPASKSDKSPK